MNELSLRSGFPATIYQLSSIIYHPPSRLLKWEWEKRTFFHQYKKWAGIRNYVGIHSLRHSFATHLLDKGTDIKYMKDLLGHFDIRTTERYLHVSKQKLVNIISPLDDLMNQGGVEW